MTTTVEADPGIGIPPKYKRNAWLLVALLIILGCLISFYQREWGWLSRFGAVITIAAMVVASFNTYFESKFVIRELDQAFDTSEMIYEEIKEKPHLYGISRRLTEDEARDVIAQERKRRNANCQMLLEKEMNGALKKLELQVAFTGTFFWGFADLLNLLRC